MAQPSFEAIRLSEQAPADQAFYEDLLNQMTDAGLRDQAARRLRLEQQRRYRAKSAPDRAKAREKAIASETDDERIERLEKEEQQASFHEWRQRQTRLAREATQERYNVGFRWLGGEAGGQYYEPFTMTGLKSDSDASGILKAFVATLPKAKNLRSGNNKAFLDRSPTKVLGLDDLMVEGNKANLGFIRLDLDFVFPDWATLNAELHAILDQLGFPMPHIAVARTRISGAVEKPHVIWLLPLKDAVRTDPQAFKSPLLLYRAVARALCAALLPLGADPGGLTNPVRVKNPLSPFLTTVIMNESKPVSLREMATKIDLSISTPELARRFVVVNAPAMGISPVASNAAFHTFRSACFATLRLWNRVGDSRLDLGDEKSTKDALVAHLGHDARHAVDGLKPKDAMVILCSVAKFAAEKFDPAVKTKKGRRHARPNAGCMYDELRGVRGLKARQARGGQRAAEHKALASAEAIFEVIKNAGVNNCNQSSVARLLGMARTTVSRHWSLVIQAVNEGCSVQTIVRKSGYQGREEKKSETNNIQIQKPTVIGQRLGDHKLISETGNWNWEISTVERQINVTAESAEDDVSGVPAFIQRRVSSPEVTISKSVTDTLSNDNGSLDTQSIGDVVPARMERLPATGLIAITDEN